MSLVMLKFQERFSKAVLYFQEELAQLDPQALLVRQVPRAQRVRLAQVARLEQRVRLALPVLRGRQDQRAQLVLQEVAEEQVRQL